jgi:hypothetical protein
MHTSTRWFLVILASLASSSVIGIRTERRRPIESIDLTGVPECRL